MKRITVGTGFEWDSKIGKVGIHAIVEHFLTKACFIEWFIQPASFFYFAKPVNLGWKLNWLKRCLEGTISYAYEESTLLCHGTIAPVHPVKQVPILNSLFVAEKFWQIATVGTTLRRPRPSSDLLIFDSGGVCMFPTFSPKAKLTIYRLNDLVGEFPHTPKGVKECEEMVIKKVDVVLPVSKPLFEKAARIRGNTDDIYLLPNGVNVDAFLKKSTEPEEFKSIPSPRAIYVGAFSEWMDWELLKEVARQKPNVSFCIIGSGASLPDQIPSNFYLLGSKSHEEIPAYLQHSHVGLIPFKDIPLIRSIERPLKFYEYIASGLPVVTVPYGSMSAMNPPAFLAETSDEFANALDQALARTPAEKVELQNLARQYSWENIFLQLDEILGKYGFNL